MQTEVISAPIYYKGMVIQPVRNEFAVYLRSDTKGSDSEYFESLEDALQYIDMATNRR